MSRKKRNKNKRLRNKKPRAQIALGKASTKTMALFGTALQHHQAGQLKEAEILYRQILQIDPNHFDALHMTGVLAYEMKQYDISINLIRKAITINPNFHYCYSNLGAIFNDLGKPEEAIACFKRAIELKPDFAKAYNELGLILNNTGKFEEAIKCCKQAIKLKPDYAEAFGNLAYFFELSNRLDDAREAAAQTFRYNPNVPIANLVAAKCERREGNLKVALDRIEKINLESSNLPAKIIILNEKGILYDRLGLYDKAFKCFSESNTLISQTSSNAQIDRSSFIYRISRLKSYFLNPHKKFWDAPVEKIKGSDPTFLIGFPRSGTTLLGKILGSRQNIQVIEEKPLIDTIIERIAAHGLRYPDDLSQINSGVIEDLKNTYFTKMLEYTTYRHDTIIIDKFPLNIVHIGLINRVFPKSKIIFALRHPADACLSCFMQNFKLNDAMVHFLNITDTANLYNLVMELWAAYVALLPLNIHVIKYEDLINDFDRETRKIFDFLEIPWDHSVHKFNQHAKSLRGIHTPSYHQVAEPIYTRSLYRWKNYAGYLKPILGILKCHVENFGYDFEDLSTDIANKRSEQHDSGISVHLQSMA